MEKVIEIIDVDDLPEPSSDDSDIVFTGFKRDASKSKIHTDQLDTEGLVYVGFKETPKEQKPLDSDAPRRPTQATPSSSKTPESDQPSSATMVQRNVGIRANAPHSESAKRPQSASNSGPPVKRRKHTHTPSTTNPHLKRGRATMRVGSLLNEDVICISDSEDEAPPAKKVPLPKRKTKDTSVTSTQRRTELPSDVEDLMDVDQEERDYATAYAALDINCRANWDDLNDPRELHLGLHSDDSDGTESDDDELVLRTAALSVTETTKRHRLHDMSARLQRSSVLDWSSSDHRSRKPHVFYPIQQSTRAPRMKSRTSRFASDFASWLGLRPLRSTCRLPKDVNTVVQCRDMIVMASAVADGSFGDTLGPYNQDGTLVVRVSGKEHVLTGHSADATTNPDCPARHHFTVNDVAIDPSCPTRFASAGRDRRVLVWEYDPLEEDEPPTLSEDIDCEDNPEVVKYHPNGSALAIQCDNGCVYIHSNDSISKAVIVPPGRGHVTAGMTWGSDASSNLLFASSACMADSTGHHKAFDIRRNKMVVEFDAAKEACSTLALDPFGEKLFIATESAEGRYTLRQFDVRNRERKAAQNVELEPFVDTTDRAAMDVNSLSLSSDGLYIAAGRTDNWADVYDARMLERGPLHSFAHEGAVAPDTYGVVKTEWVDGSPYGVGLVTGGIDGCVRLWDVRHASDDPLNGTILAQGVDDVATFALGDIYKGEIPIILGEKSGKVTMFNHLPRE